jgi:ketosteroid isomerase-like protein
VGVSENKKFVIDFVEALSSGDIQTVQAAFADDATWWFPGSLPFSGTHKGKKAILEDFFGQGLPLFEPGTFSIEVRGAIGEGDCVAVEWVTRGKNTRGQDFENAYHVVFEVKGGKIQTVRHYGDTAHTKEVLLS